MRDAYFNFFKVLSNHLQIVEIRTGRDEKTRCGATWLLDRTGAMFHLHHRTIKFVSVLIFDAGYNTHLAREAFVNEASTMRLLINTVFISALNSDTS